MHNALQLETVGEIVRLLRARRGMEQIELASACGWRDASAVSRIETDRIHPTRRTLLKLAAALADDDSTGSAEELRSWLFLAAGILPTAEEIQALRLAIPAIEAWTQPAMVMDFGWYVWRINDAFIKWVGFPESYAGRNLLELVFDESVRGHLGDHWINAARAMLGTFRAETERRADQRWRTTLMTRMTKAPGFAEVWADSEPAPRGQVYLRTRATLGMGSVALVRLTLTADPRLMLSQIIPDGQAPAG